MGGPAGKISQNIFGGLYRGREAMTPFFAWLCEEEKAPRSYKRLCLAEVWCAIYTQTIQRELCHSESYRVTQVDVCLFLLLLLHRDITFNGPL